MELEITRENSNISEFSFSGIDRGIEPKFSLIIPAYNEENRIGSFLKSLISNLNSLFEVIVVCDGNDLTAKIVNQVDPKIKILEFNDKLGKGGAIIEGFRAARGDIVGYVDADGSIPWYEIQRAFSSVSKVTPVIVGSRWLRSSKILHKQPWHRIILGRLYHYLTFALLGISVKDTQCGLKVYRFDVVQAVLRNIRLRNLSVDTAFLYHCKELGIRIKEMPIEWKDIPGSKFSSGRTVFYMLLTLVGLKISHSRFSNHFQGFISDTIDKINLG